MMPLLRKTIDLRFRRGQALIEYALILALLAIAMAIALAATGPAIAGVFSNVICNVAGQSPCGAELANLNQYGNPNNFWQTVTWVAQNPQGETPFATPELRPPTIAPTENPNPINTNTPVPSITPRPSSTLGPSATPADNRFTLPFYDPADALVNWRTDSSVYVGGDEWVGYYYQNTTFSGTPTIARNGIIPGANPLSLAFDWGSGPPLAIGGWTATDNFSVRWIRRIDISAQLAGRPLRFSVSADDRASVWHCPDEAATANPAGCTQLLNNVTDGTATATFAEGSYWLLVHYVENSGNARIRLDIGGVGGVNPDDVVGAGGECSWGLKAGGDTNSLNSMFDENPASDAWPSNQVCYLELRGRVDMIGAARPILSFWDVWDLPAGAVARIEISEYSADRTSHNWRPIAVRTGGTNVRNYAWTRSEVSLANLTPALTTSEVTFRFVLDSTGAGGALNPARWYLDDIRVEDVPESVYTVGNVWRLDNANDQRQHFITSGRWALTTTRTHGGMAFEDSSPAGTNYDRHSQGGPRIHYVELLHPVDLSIAPATDHEGDSGSIIFSMWHAYEIAPGTQLRVEYTRDPRDTTPDNWITIGDTGGVPNPAGLLANNTGTSTLARPVIQPVEIPLELIPNYNTQPFRLRLALYVPEGGAVADGWWIDDIKIERGGVNNFTGYPFVDGAEDLDFTERNWTRIGSWATAFGDGVFENGNPTGRFYADTPVGNYLPNETTWMEMRRTIDLLYDTDLNVNNPGTIGEAAPASVAVRQNITRPVLMFWHKRDVQAGVRFAIDITTSSLDDGNPMTPTDWREIWFYAAPSTNPRTSDGFDLSLTRRQQFSWERVEIDLIRALETATGLNWNTIRTNANETDDDFRIRIRLVAGATAGDGISLDWLQIRELPEITHRLWGATPVPGSVAATAGLGAGDGDLYEDFIESVFPNPSLPLDARWWVGVADWRLQSAGTGTNPLARSGAFSLHDLPDANYANNTASYLELRPVIDLRGVTAAENPALYYWQRFGIGTGGDQFRVQISVEDSTQTASRHGLMPGWSAWQTIAPRPYTELNENTRRLGWQRQLVLLNTYVGKRIKVRWVVNSMNDSGNDFGWYIDNVRFAYNYLGGGQTAAIPMVGNQFFDSAESTNNWVMEGLWGLAADRFRGDPGSFDLGGTLWTGHWVNCETHQLPAEGCWYNGMITSLNRLWPIPGTGATTVPPLSAAGVAANLPTETTPLIMKFLNETSTPPECPVVVSGPCNPYMQSVGARYMRRVTLEPGNYVVQISHDDGARMWINNGSGTTEGANFRVFYENSSWMERTVLRTDFLSVTSATPIVRIIGVDYFQGGPSEWNNPGHLYVNIARERYSFSDSPNTPNVGGGFTTVNAVRPSNTSMISNGYFNLSGMPDPYLQFYWVGDLQNNHIVSVEFSTDGGFTWTSLTSFGNTISFPADWNRVNFRLNSNGTFNALSAAAKSRVMFRFRMNAGSANRDGAYITDIFIGQP